MQMMLILNTQGHARSFVDFLLTLNTILEILHITCIYPYPTSLPGGTGKRQLKVGGHDLV